MTALTGKTRLLGVMGWPVSHTKSPVFQNAALRAAGLDAVYVPLPVDPARVAEAVRGVRALGFVGCNVTIPHKLAVMEHLDALTPEAELVGAVNTIRVEPDGRLTGHNTDCLGAVRAVERDGGRLRGATVLVLGAGGAGRGAAVGAALAGARHIIVLNRTAEKAAELVQELRGRPGIPPEIAWTAGPLSDGFDDDLLPWREVSVVLQMTSLGMGDNRELPCDPQWLRRDCHVLEAVYAPLETEFLRRVRGLGLPATDGLAMLVEQGAEAFRFWLGMEPDVAVMRAALQPGGTKPQ